MQVVKRRDRPRNRSKAAEVNTRLDTRLHPSLSRLDDLGAEHVRDAPLRLARGEQDCGLARAAHHTHSPASGDCGCRGRILTLMPMLFSTAPFMMLTT